MHMNIPIYLNIAMPNPATSFPVVEAPIAKFSTQQIILFSKRQNKKYNNKLRKTIQKWRKRYDGSMSNPYIKRQKHILTPSFKLEALEALYIQQFLLRGFL